MMRSVTAVATGVVVWGVLWVGSNVAFATALPTRFDDNGVTTDPALLVSFIFVSSALSVLAGWLCAHLARRSRMRHVTVIAVLQLAIGIFVQAGVWELMPLWYHLIFLAAVVPMHLAGGSIRVARGGARHEAREPAAGSSA